MSFLHRAQWAVTTGSSITAIHFGEIAQPAAGIGVSNVPAGQTKSRAASYRRSSLRNRPRVTEKPRCGLGTCNAANFLASLDILSLEVVAAVGDDVERGANATLILRGPDDIGPTLVEALAIDAHEKKSAEPHPGGERSRSTLGICISWLPLFPAAAGHPLEVEQIQPESGKRVETVCAPLPPTPAWLKTPLARRNNRRPIDRHSLRRLRPALHPCPDRKSNSRRPGSGARRRSGSDDDTRPRGNSRRTGGPGRTSDDARPLDRSMRLSPNRGSGRRLSIGRERMPEERPTLQGSQSNPSCRFPALEAVRN